MIDSFMKNAKGLTRNPLGIIALFISLIYGFACLVLSASIANLTTTVERLPLIWFIILFPVVILIGFIFLVVKHHEKLYAPSDFADESTFAKTFSYKNVYKEVTVEFDKEQPNQPTNLKQAILKTENTDFNEVLFSDDGKKNLEIANKVSDSINSKIGSEFFEKKILDSLSFGVHAPEYYMAEFNFKPELFKDGKKFSESVIIRVTEASKGEYVIIGIGKGILVKSPQLFGEELKEYIIKRILEPHMKEEEFEKFKN